MQPLIDAILMPLDSGARIYWPFLLSSLAVMTLWSGKKGLREFFHKSSLLDLKILGLNLVLKTFLFPLFVFSSYQISVPTLKSLRLLFPNFSGLSLDGVEASLLATLIAFVVDDFFRFFHHYLMHKQSFLRRVHRTHHSALVLTPFTLYRTHPIEVFIASLRNVLSIGLGLGLYSFFLQRPVTGLEILGVNLFGFTFNALLSNLRHSSVPISFGFFEYFLISPRMHQIHHSNNPIHFGKNYGVALAVWDQLFGSFYKPKSGELKNLTFGVHQELDEKALTEATTLKGALISGLELNSLLAKPLPLKSIIQEPRH